MLDIIVFYETILHKAIFDIRFPDAGFKPNWIYICHEWKP